MEALGIEPFYLLAQIVNFAIIFWVLRKFLYKPVLTFLDKRKDEIAQSIDSAKKMEQEEAKMQEKQEKLVSDAKKEARSIMDEAKKQLEKQKKEVLAKAHEEASEIIAKAKKQAEQELKQNNETIQKMAVELAQSMVVKLVPSVLSDSDHHKLIATHLKDIQKQVKVN